MLTLIRPVNGTTTNPAPSSNPNSSAHSNAVYCILSGCDAVIENHLSDSSASSLCTANMVNPPGHYRFYETRVEQNSVWESKRRVFK